MSDRMFLAFDAPHTVARKLRELYDRSLSLRWVKPENLHLTLLYLGDVDERDHERVFVCAGKAAMKYAPIPIRVLSIGPYKSMVWGQCQPDPKLSSLVRDLTSGMWAAGLPVRRENYFKAHLCLARGRSPEDVEAYRERAVEDIGWTATHIVVFKSTLTLKGPIYESLDAFALQNSAND